MYRMLIVDDEEYVADGLTEFFKSQNEIELDVYCAYSGEEAVNWMNRMRMDVVLTDIQMPGLNGMELMKIIRRNWPFCRVIFLTGYVEFNFVYQAIQYPNVKFLLKTEGYQKILGAVREAVSEIERSIHIESLIRQTEQQMDQARDFLQRDYILGLIQANNPTDDVKSQLQRLGIKLDADAPFFFILGKIYKAEDGIPYTDRVRLLCSAGLVVSSHISAITPSVFVLDDRYYVLALVQFVQPVEKGDGDCRGSLLDQSNLLRGCLELVQRECLKSIGVGVSFILSKEPVQWENIFSQYRRMQQILTYRSDAGNELILSDDYLGGLMSAPKDSAQQRRIYACARDRDVFQSCLEKGEKANCIQVMDRILSNVCGGENGFSKRYREEVYYSVALVLLSYINRYGLEERLIKFIDLEKLMQYESHASGEEAVKYLKSLLGVILDVTEKSKKETISHEIDFLKDHIANHLKDDLSLVCLAELMHFNPTYLSRMFKLETGEKISDFISRLRISQAKSMLRRTNVRIQDVGEAIGYHSTTNFIRFFKKATGVTPKVFRDTI